MKPPVVVEAYDPAWPLRFEAEAAALRTVLGDAPTIIHIGSTAVEGLAAKPIVDIMIGVHSLDDAATMIAPIVSLGYQYIPEYEAEMPERRYFKKLRADGIHTHHIHLVEAGSPFWERHVYFRDRLRSDRELAAQYADLKKELAERYRNDRVAYTDAKTNFIVAVENELERKNKARERTHPIAQQHLATGDRTGWFEEVYKTAGRTAASIPWADSKPNPYLVSWLDEHKIVGTGRTALVIGCGLGDDAEALAARGFAVTAFDIAPSAIAWAKERFPKTSVNYQVADLFSFSNEQAGKFDFIFECYTVQALPRDVRDEAIDAVCRFLAPKGELLVVARGWRGEGLENGPPWPITDEEMKRFETQCTLRSSEEFWEEDLNTRRIRCSYSKD
ncbi:MAG: GrpB family protein [Bacteroidetes bacterium]|nr:GrpB family protein [Bacteroidota bacterium]